MVPNSYLEPTQQIAPWCAVLPDKGTLRMQTMDSFWKPCTGPSLSFITAHHPTRGNAAPDYSQCQPCGQGHSEALRSCCANPQWFGVVVVYVEMLNLSSALLGWSVKVQFSNLEDSCKACKAICRYSQTTWFWKVLSSSSGYSQLWESFTIFSEEPGLASVDGFRINYCLCCPEKFLS